MLKLLNKSTLVQLIVLMVAMVLLWGRAVVVPPAWEPVAGEGILYGLLAQALSNSPRVAVLLTAMLVLAEGIGINLLLAEMGLVSKNSFLPALLCIVVMSAPAAPFPPAVFVGAMLIGYISQVKIKGTLLTISTAKVCSATALISLCTLFYLPSVAFLLSYLIVVVSYRLYSWRDLMALLLGLLAPYVMLTTVLYLSDGLGDWWRHTSESIADMGLRVEHSTWLPLVGRGVVVAMVIASIVAYAEKVNERPVVWQKNAEATVSGYAGAVVVLLLTILYPPDVRFLAVPFALTGTVLLTRTPAPSLRRNRKNWLPDVLLILTIIAALVC